jgi:hypothetical protein
VVVGLGPGGRAAVQEGIRGKEIRGVLDLYCVSGAQRRRGLKGVGASCLQNLQNMLQGRDVRRLRMGLVRLPARLPGSARPFAHLLLRAFTNPARCRCCRRCCCRTTSGSLRQRWLLRGRRLLPSTASTVSPVLCCTALPQPCPASLLGLPVSRAAAAAGWGFAA